MRGPLAYRRVPHEKARIPACGMGERIGAAPKKRKRQLGLDRNHPKSDVLHVHNTGNRLNGGPDGRGDVEAFFQLHLDLTALSGQ